MIELHDFKQRSRSAMMLPAKGDTPGWSVGLRQLYRGVAEEPMPAAFDDLLARLEACPVAKTARRGPIDKRDK